MIKTLADLLKAEAKHVNNGFCYSTYPYACCIDEALIDAKRYKAPTNPTITRIDNDKITETTIELKPLPGSRKRKPFTITLYWWK
jgi:hypothetical protein